MATAKKNSPHASKVSPQTQAQALQMAKATQKPGQTKEQTKLIAQGIERGIDLYKKQQKAKAKLLDKEKKKRQKQQVSEQARADKIAPEETKQQAHSLQTQSAKIAWGLLALSWVFFLCYFFIFK